MHGRVPHGIGTAGRMLGRAFMRLTEGECAHHAARILLADGRTRGVQGRLGAERSSATPRRSFPTQSAMKMA